MKKVISYILLILWISIIFILSHQPSGVSGDISGSLIYDVFNFIYDIFNLNTSNLNNFIEMIHEPIREVMHALEYLILAILTMNALYQSKIKKYMVSTILFCFIYSISDEVHQLFIDGRTFQILDLFMDFIGYMLGSLISYKLIFKNVTKEVNKI